MLLAAENSSGKKPGNSLLGARYFSAAEEGGVVVGRGSAVGEVYGAG